MCLAIPGKVIKVLNKQVEVQYPHETRTVLQGIENLNVGDHVMVQMGIAIKKITHKEAENILSAWSEI